MRRWNIVIGVALAAALTAGGNGTAWAKLSDYDAQTAARLQDNTMEFGELKNLIREYNPQMKYAYGQLEFSGDDSASTARELRDAIDRDDYQGQLKAAREKKKELEQMPDFDGKEEAVKGAEAGIRLIEQMLNTPSSQTKASDKQIEKMKKSLDQSVDQILMGTQTLMISYDTLRSQIKTLETVEELQTRTLSAARVKAGAGLDTDTGVLQAQSSLLSTQSQLAHLKNLEDGLHSQLCLLTGWKTDAAPDIGSVPAADPSLIADIDLEADTKTAIGNNKTLISKRHSPSDKTTAGIDSRNKSIEESEQRLTIELKRLYMVVQQKKALYDAASTAYQKALLAKGAAEAEYKMKTMSPIGYLGAEVQYYQAESSRKSADTALLQAMLDYGWAVSGYVTVPQ